MPHPIKAGFGLIFGIEGCEVASSLGLGGGWVFGNVFTVLILGLKLHQVTPMFYHHISSVWVKIRLHTEFQLPRLSGSALKV